MLYIYKKAHYIWAFFSHAYVQKIILVVFREV